MNSPRAGLNLGSTSVNGPAKARRLYLKARFLASLTRIASTITGKHNELAELNRLIYRDSIDGWKYLGVREVPIKEIVGSEKSNAFFDRRFNPRPGLDRQRWLDIATARLSGIQLPPIELIQLSHGYYAQSGHYRISVVQTLGEATIRAYVTSLDLRET